MRNIQDDGYSKAFIGAFTSEKEVTNWLLQHPNCRIGPKVLIQKRDPGEVAWVIFQYENTEKAKARETDARFNARHDKQIYLNGFKLRKLRAQAHGDTSSAEDVI